MVDVLAPLSRPLEEEERLPDELVAELRKGELLGLTIPQESSGALWRPSAPKNGGALSA